MKVLTLFSGFVALLILSNTTLACSCPPVLAGTTPQQLVKSRYDKAEAVFSGKVIKIKARKSTESNPQSLLVVTLKVSEVWKGIDTQRVVITTDNSPAGCGTSFEKGESYLVYAHRWSGSKLETSACTGTTELSNAERDLEVIGKGSVPKNEL